MEAKVVEKNELVVVVDQSGLEQETAKTLLENFTPLFQQANEWKEKAARLVVTDVSQTRLMQECRVARLALKDIRISADKTRKALKEDSLRYGKAVQGVYNVIEYLIAPIESHLQEQEDFAKVQEQKRKEELKVEREEKLAPFGIETSFYDLGGMTEPAFTQLYDSCIAARDKKIEDDRNVEKERIAKEQAELLEKERIRLENEELKKAQEELNKRLDEERKAEQAKNQLRLERNAVLKKYDYLCEWDVAEMEEEDFGALVLEQKNVFEDAEKKRIEAEQAEAEAREQREEELRLEREAKEAAEKELKERQDKEAKELADKQTAEELEAAKGDKAKFQDLINELQAIINNPKYSFKSKKFKTAYAGCVDLLNKVINFLISKQ